MEVQSNNSFWWLKSSKSTDRLKLGLEQEEPHITSSTPKESDDTPTISNSLKEFLEKERALRTPEGGDADIGSILDEINKLAAQSPLGPYEEDPGERSVEDIMKEAEKIYMESSKSFEQLSARSRTSANLSISFNESAKSTPTPKSASPLPLDPVGGEKDASDEEKHDEESYSDDFTQEISSEKPNQQKNNDEEADGENNVNNDREPEIQPDGDVDYKATDILGNQVEDAQERRAVIGTENLSPTQEEATGVAEVENILLLNYNVAKTDSNEAAESPIRSLMTPQTNMDKLLEELKDSEEANTVLRLQLDNLNEAHRLLKIAYDDLLTSNKQLDEKTHRVELELIKCEEILRKTEKHRDKLLENEGNLEKLVETEKLRANTAKIQNEKDARCISDLNRQVKEMERIIARKHPDSVSALIVAAKDDRCEKNLTARKVLEDRIKILENEVAHRDRHSSKVFLEVQEKFDEMKKKYESHIEDLELHVNDLKDQLKRKNDTFDVYTQTFFDEQKIPSKETHEIGVQTAKLQMAVQKTSVVVKRSEKNDGKEDAHLLATIRGLQADLVNKEKVTIKLQRELDEVKKTNKRLQKEREGNLKNIVDGKNFHAGYSEKIAFMRVQNGEGDVNVELEEELRAVKADRDKMKVQLCRMEEDYQNLKGKRLYDLSTLQRAHEEEISGYVKNMESLQEQLKIQQITINSLQDQLHHNRFPSNIPTKIPIGATENQDINSNQEDHQCQQISIEEQKLHEQEWCRLRAILQGLSQKNTSNRGCQQCITRQQELIMYKTELDDLLATLRKLT